MEAGADLEQGTDAAADLGSTLGRLGDAREELQQRRLAGAVSADEADHLALLDLEARVAEGPQLADVLVGRPLPYKPARDIRERLRSVARSRPCSRRAGSASPTPVR